jgi:CHASE2 domain-containing sensor protein
VSSNKKKAEKDDGNNIKQSKAVNWLGTASYALLFTLFSFLADQSNLFGVGEVVHRQNERIYQRLTAGSYGADPDNAQEKLAVLLYTDEIAQLKPRGLGWPMDLAEFGELMSAVRDAKAQGIFIDIVFRSVEHDRKGFCGFFETVSDISGLAPEGLSNFDNCMGFIGQPQEDNEGTGAAFDNKLRSWPVRKEKLERIHEHKGIPVLVGASLDYLNARKAFLSCEDSYNCTHRAAFINVIKSWPVTAMLDHVAILVPLSGGAESGRAMHLSVDEAGHASPAWLIARQIAEDSGFKRDQYAFLNAPPPTDRNLYIKWGGSVSRKQHVAIPLNQFDSCFQRGQLGWKMTKLFAGQVFPQTSSADDLIAGCPYHLTVDMYDYYHSVPMDQMDAEFRNDVSDKFDLSVLEELLIDRFVLVGLAMKRFSDHIDSPVQGSIAGVYAHAMAVDNLLNYARNYYYTDPQVTDGVVGPYWWFLILQYLLTAVGAFWMLSKFDDVKKTVNEGPANKQWTFCGVLVVIVGCLVLLTGLVKGVLVEGSKWLDLVLITALFFAICYTLYIYQGQRLLKASKSVLKKPTRLMLDEWIALRRTGLCQCMPHVALILLAFFILTILGTVVSAWFRYDPFNSLYTFLSLLSLYMVGARNETIGGVATFLMNEDIAEEFFG